MMKVFSAAVIVCALAVSANAADLAGMGFGGMQQLSDNDGLAIRGKGTSASVWGQGSSLYNGKNGSTSSTQNGYEASASHYGRHDNGSSTAVGSNLSVSGSANGVSWGSGTIVKFNVIGSFGTSSAYAK